MVKANPKVVLGKKKVQNRINKAAGEEVVGVVRDSASTTSTVAVAQTKKGKVNLVPSDYVAKELTKVQKKKLKAKQKAEVKPPNPEPEVHQEPTRRSDDPIAIRGRWRNKQRVLLFASRGISHQGRHIMEDLRHLLPHTKKESKMDKRDTLFAINEISEMKNCNKCVFFEGRRHDDIYLWVSTIPEGPSAKFLVENMNTMDELKFTGNCLKGSRAILSFDPQFDSEPHLKLLRELFTQTFGTPYQFPRSQPFIDHVFTFTVLDNRIWFRNFQIMEEDGSLVEIGPRFTLNPIRIFDGSFNGATLWSNKHYISPGKYRSMIKQSGAGKYMNKVQQKLEYKRSKPKSSYKLDPSDEIFHVDPEALKK